MLNTINNKRIVKNTFILYIRMFFTLGVSLYTSRVVLNTLGVEDYGVYSIVGGIVTLFSFFNGAMTSVTQRYIAIDLVENDLFKLTNTFNATLNIHFGIAILVLILAESIGFWFVNNKLNVPLDRMVAVNWVYQFSVFTFLMGIIQVPYDALIFAREKMDIYAYMAIIEVILKLIIVYFLVVFTDDKLILYAGLMFLVSFIVRLGHKQYCKLHFEESKYRFYFDKSFYKELLSYSGWSLFGNIASVARGQGSNILLNLFFGTVLNAAYGISLQVQSALQGFVLNFQMAVNPQIFKQYAAGNKDECLKLIFQSAKFSYFLLFLITTPIIFNIDFILEFWLKNTPKYTAVFVNFSLLNMLIDCISGPLMIGAQATGNIKWYQIILGTIIFMCMPISYFLLTKYNDPKIIFFVIIAINAVSLLGRLLFLKKMIGLDIKSFVLTVLSRIIIVTGIFVITIYFIDISTEISYLDFFLKSISLTIINLISIFSIGLNKNERNIITTLLKKKLKLS
ncbi:oligosaccharide flippase family protein [Aquirufa sp. LEPPI-3A]|uniref:lipopolysaccharide biosynthesis protein n=1 Tax=Aquirufa regiilacus TaxID=3024868 RepID=UPI0028DD4605|nr:oligosaccharide flippase family protein [Aquirufa sp. LEPPI-3A]MDT8887875.1 oligosaccharide flippase family protein [Aquirufa sp. LEPPI-3A]